MSSRRSIRVRQMSARVLAQFQCQTSRDLITRAAALMGTNRTLSLRSFFYLMYTATCPISYSFIFMVSKFKNFFATLDSTPNVNHEMRRQPSLTVVPLSFKVLDDGTLLKRYRKEIRELKQQLVEVRRVCEGTIVYSCICILQSLFRLNTLHPKPR